MGVLVNAKKEKNCIAVDNLFLTLQKLMKRLIDCSSDQEATGSLFSFSSSDNSLSESSPVQTGNRASLEASNEESATSPADSFSQLNSFRSFSGSLVPVPAQGLLGGPGSVLPGYDYHALPRLNTVSNFPTGNFSEKAVIPPRAGAELEAVKVESKGVRDQALVRPKSARTTQAVQPARTVAKSHKQATHYRQTSADPAPHPQVSSNPSDSSLAGQGVCSKAALPCRTLTYPDTLDPVVRKYIDVERGAGREGGAGEGFAVSELSEKKELLPRQTSVWAGGDTRASTLRSRTILGRAEARRRVEEKRRAQPGLHQAEWR